jgi:PAS domain S-box-containing protein
MVSQTAPLTALPQSPGVGAAEMLCVLNANGVIRFATPATATLYGYALPDLIGRSALRFIAPEHQADVTARWEALRSDPTLFSDQMQVALIAANGRRVPIRVSIWRMPDRDEFLLIHHVVEHLQARLETLYSIMADVSGTSALNTLFDNVLREIHRLIPCHVSTIYMLEHGDTIAARRWPESDPDHADSTIRELLPALETSQIMRETGRPLVIYDCDTDPRWVRVPGHHPIRSWLGAPLIYRGEFMGELHLDHPEPNAFSAEDAELVQALASQIAGAIHTLRQLEDEQRQAKRHQVLSDISQAISQLDLPSVLEVVYRKINSLMDASSFFIALYDAEAQQTRFVGSYEKGVAVPDTVEEAQAGLTGLVLHTRRSLIIHDSAREPVPDAVIVEGELPRSLLMFPLITQDEIVGVISAQSYEPNAYSSDDIETMEAIAGVIASAVRNAQLYDQALERLTTLEMLHQMSLDLAATQAPETITQLVARAALDLFQPGEVRLRLCEGAPWDPIPWIGHATGQNRPPRIEPRAGLTATSLETEVFATGQPVIWPDLSREPDLQAEFGMPWRVQAAALYPIMRGGHTFAVLTLMYPQPNFFRRDTLRALDLLCMQAATAFENARYMLTLRRRLDEVTALQDLARQVSSHHALGDIFQIVVETLQEVYQCRGAWIALCDDTAGEVVIKAATGLERQYVERARFKIGEYAAGKVVETGQPIYVADTHNDPQFRLIDPGVCSVMIVPLTARGRVIGTLGIDGAVPYAFTPEHERVLTIAGGQIAAAIETLNLLQQTRERADLLAVANASLEAQDALRKELVYQVSHDLRSPLQIVYGYADMLFNAELGPVTEMQKDVLALMLKRTRSIERLTLDIMAVKPISREVLELKPVDLNALCQQAIVDSQMLHEEVGVVFEGELAPGELLVEGDYNRLSRVFDNLISNAVKFSPEGGTITIRSERESGGQRALISISDQGIGIPPDHLPYVFERFFRGNRKRFAGSGLGLYNVQQIVEAHQGQVWVTSQEGTGSTFTFALPLIDKQ